MDSKSENTRPNRPPQSERKHPDEWRGDLNPDQMAGQNVGARSAEREVGLRTAHEIKAVHRQLPQLQNDELKQIPVLDEGTRLEQGAVHIDLRDPARSEITATGDMKAEAGSLHVPKARVPYELWNRLIGEPRNGGDSATGAVEPDQEDEAEPVRDARNQRMGGGSREAQDRARTEGTSQGQAESPVDRMDIEAPRKRG